MTKITFYGGIHEIGGNKFLVEDKGTRVFLDFGMQMGKVNDYFSEFLKPRALNGMGDLFEFGLLPKLPGLYRQDYAKHMGFDGKEETAFDALVLTHAHVDHAAYIHYLRPDIPVYCSEATKLILQGIQDTGGKEDYLTFKHNFRIYENKKGEMSRGKGEDYQEPRKISVFENAKKFTLDSIEVEPLAVDHSLPGVTGIIMHTSKGSIGYTADIRYHGRRAGDTERFVERCGNSDIDVLLCEGTRVEETFSTTEFSVEQDVKTIVNKTKGLVVCTYPTRDLDRLLSFYNAAKESERDLVIDLKQAYLLKLFQKSEQWKNVFPKPDDKRIKIYLPRKSWGLVGREEDDISSYWTEKQLLQDYEVWERQFLNYGNAVNYHDVFNKQKDYIFYCNDYQLQQLIDVRPIEGSSYIRSQTEPFDDEMELKEERVKRWIEHFRLITSEKDWTHTHVSGHGSGDQIKKVIEGTKSKMLVPIHTEHEEYHKKWHNNVIEVTSNHQLALQ
ncbi:MBL fold metallo-hydrolase [Nitrososphaera sp.]|uniref:MBL fold metallo-hydrolase n=1 Tax=Nitrososphaera sp. TaxID=1971748 RepID=UPI00182AA15D|nr:MBL fold metallo-hydrolase [Nitrososphaera sp.]NWG36704.1 MBL fold metallo-hydrolase [Nitrososphaera sp.]